MNACAMFEWACSRVLPVLLVAAVAFGLGVLLGRLGRASRWIDAHGGDPELRARKPRRTAVPLVGGLALYLSLAFARALGVLAVDLPWLALTLALLVGTLDDLKPRGLGWRQKLALQVLVALACAMHGTAPLGEKGLVFLMALLAQNAANTFDNADGALLGLSALGLHANPACLGAHLGLLPLNLWWRRGKERVPSLYLGDAGSHLVGVLWASQPMAWPILLLPLADLLRLVLLRRRLGRQPWQGDRRHLAHRLALQGIQATGVVLVLVCIAAPSALAAQRAPELWIGAGITLLFFGISLRLTPNPA